MAYKRQSPVKRRQIYERKTRKLQQKNQNLTGRAVGAIGHAVGKAVDDAKGKKKKEKKKEATGETIKTPGLGGGPYQGFGGGIPERTLPTISEVPVLIGKGKSTAPEPPADPPVGDVAKVVQPNTGIGGTQWTPGERYANYYGPQDVPDRETYPVNQGGTFNNNPGGALNVPSFGYDTGGIGTSYGPSLPPSPTPRKPGMVEEYKKGNYRKNPYGKTPLKRYEEMSPFKRDEEFVAPAESLDAGGSYVPQMQRASAPSYLGDLGAAAAEGYNVAVDRHNYKQQVWAAKQHDLDEAYGALQVAPTGQSSWDAQTKNLAMEWKHEFTELYNNKDQYDPAEYTERVASIKGRAAEFQQASNNLKTIVGDYESNIDDISASTPPETIDILETLRKNTGTLAPINVDGVPTLQGVTIGGKEVSVPISELANGKNLWRFNKKFDVQPGVDAIANDLGKFRTEVAQNGGISTQQVPWEQLQGRASGMLESLLANPQKTQAVAAERFGIDNDDWKEMEASGLDPTEEVRKRLLMEIQNQFQPYTQVVSGTKVDPRVREQRLAAQAQQKAATGSTAGERQNVQNIETANQILTTEFMSNPQQGLASQGYDIIGYDNLSSEQQEQVTQRYGEGAYVVKVGKKNVVVPPDASREWIARNIMGVDPAQLSPLNRSPFKRLTDWMGITK